MDKKQGNADFVRCPQCAEWFLVSASLLDAETIELHCPGCARRFIPADAAEILRS